MDREQGLLEELVEVAGLQAVIRICRQFGGRPIYIPAQMTETHPVSLAIGYESAKELSRRHGGERLQIPPEVRALMLKRNAEIVAMYQSGAAISELAREFAVSRAWINRLLDKAGVRKT